MAPERPYVGGQAVLGGVMMRAPRSMAVAVRRPDGSIVVREDPWISISERLRALRWPILRGSIVLLESIYNGITALNFAAEQSTEPREKRPGDPDQAGSRAGTFGTMVLSFAIAIGLFVGLPHLLAWGAGRAAGSSLDVDRFAFHALDGLFKLAVFVGYIASISLVPEIRSVFEYHGAEHKVVNAYESGLALEVESAQAQTTFHARCGTSFILFVLVLSILMFALVLPFVPAVSGIAAVNHLAMICLKIPLMLPLAGVAYEINRYAARHPGQAWVQLLVGPGRLMQKLTTRPPTDDQIEIALAAMRAALRREASLRALDPAEAERLVRAEPAGGRVAVFSSYRELMQAFPAAGR